MGWVWGIGIFIALLVALFIYNDRSSKAAVAKIMAGGKPTKGWIVFANDVLYRPSEAKVDRGFEKGLIVFTLDPQVTDLPATLESWAEQLRQFEAPEGAEGDERIIGSVMRTQVGYSRPLRLPERITGGREGYLSSLDIYRDKLPGGVLTQPYVECQALPGDGGGVEMLDYPRA
jgi:hypothetical protein